jgi:hypothetical protein
MADTQGIRRIIEVAVDGSRAVAQLTNIAKSTKELNETVEESIESFKKMAEFFGVGLGVHELASQFLETAEAMDEIGKAAQRVGVEAQGLQQLRYAALSTGASTQDMDKALQKLSVNLQEVGDISSKAGQALRALGVNAGDNAQKALAKISEEFSKIPDGAQKTALAIELLGKEAGPMLIPMLNKGAEGLSEMAVEAKKLGLVLSDDTIKAAEKFGDEMQTLGFRSKVAGQQFIAPILPTLTGFVKTLNDLAGTEHGIATWGATVSKELAGVAGLAILAGTAFEKLAIGLRFAFSKKDMSTAIAEFKKGWEDADKAGADALEKLANNIAEATLAATGHGAAQAKSAKETADAAEEANKLAKALQDQANAQANAAAAAERERRDAESGHDFYEKSIKLQKELNDEAGKQADIQKILKPALDQTNKSFEDQAEATLAVGKAYGDVDAEFKAYIRNQDEQNARQQALIELTQTGTEEQKKWAGQLLANMLLLQHAAPVVSEEWTKMADAMDQAWGRFLESVSSGTVSVATAFSAMVRSILADLLKIYARKYIVDMLLAIWGGSTGRGGGGGGFSTEGGDQTGALGLAFSSGRTVPLASGGIIGSPVRVPMALMGEAGPEAVLPLQRTGSGALGVAAASLPALNVAIHNHTDANVRASRGRSGDLQVVIEATKRSMAADFRRGGNDLARAAEAAWGLNRGAGAPY